MIYADYEYYTGTFGGSAISAADFPRLARRASAEVDHVTFGRILKLDEIPDAVKDAVCEVAEKLQEQENSEKNSAGIASENNDGYSVSYRDDGGEAGRAHERYLAIRSYLAVTGLMYRGIDDPEED